MRETSGNRTRHRQMPGSQNSLFPLEIGQERAGGWVGLVTAREWHSLERLGKEFAGSMPRVLFGRPGE